jgi:hypothetical protein
MVTTACSLLVVFVAISFSVPVTPILIIGRFKGISAAKTRRIECEDLSTKEGFSWSVKVLFSLLHSNVRIVNHIFLLTQVPTFLTSLFLAGITPRLLLASHMQASRKLESQHTALHSS